MVKSPVFWGGYLALLTLLSVACTGRAPEGSTHFELEAGDLGGSAFPAGTDAGDNLSGDSFRAAGDRNEGDSAESPQQVVVELVYPGMGDWLDYVRHDGNGTGLEQAGLRCDGSEAGSPSRCVHAGLMRRVRMLGYACEGLKVVDQLQALRWICRDEGADAVFYSYGLQANIGLGELIDASGWRYNQVRISSDGVLLAQSLPHAWWNNAIVPLADTLASSTALDAVGTIYVAHGDVQSGGYFLGADRVAVVVRSPFTLRYVDGGLNLNSATGSLAAPDSRALLATRDANFLWVEGRMDATGTSRGFSAWYSRFSRIHRAEIFGAGDQINVHVFDRSVISATRLYHPSGAGRGLLLNVVNDLYLRDVRVSNLNKGIFVMGECNRCRFIDVGYFNNVRQGMQANTTDDSVFVGNIAVGNGGDAGIGMWSFQRNTVAFSTFVNNGGNGLRLLVGTGFSVVNVVAMNNGGPGIYVTSTGTRFSQLVSTHNGGSGVHLAAADGVFEANLLFGNNGAGNCSATVASAGLEDVTCANNGGSTASLTVGLDTTLSFNGAVIADDLANLTDTDGVGSYVGSDWRNFDNTYRGWGRVNAAFPSSSERSRCAGPNCQLWDWRLHETDTVLRNRSGNFVSPNVPFVAGAACPLAVHGDRAITDAVNPPNTFLINARELLDDFLGDEDALCESGETCVYAPHYGVYLGAGEARGTAGCAFSDGLVSGVRMLAHPR